MTASTARIAATARAAWPDRLVRRAGMLGLLAVAGCQPAETATVPVTCTDIPAAICNGTDWWQDSPYRPPRLVAVEVTCDGVCDESSGAATVALILDNGFRAGYSYGWDGAPPSS